MIFVDTNVFMYAVGREHPLRDEARAVFLDPSTAGSLATSAEVLQELMHAYLPVGRMDTLDAALELARARTAAIWTVEAEDVELARSLVVRHPGLGARDLLHLACMMRRGATGVRTFDRALGAAWG